MTWARSSGPDESSTRTSGTGTRRSSRSGWRTSIPTAAGPRCDRCSRASGTTGWFRTSCSTCPRRTTTPGPELWDSAACAGAPGVPTSGLTQPPVLATAVRVLQESSPDRAFLEEVVPATRALARVAPPASAAPPTASSPSSIRGRGRTTHRASIAHWHDSTWTTWVDIERTDRREIDASERPTDSDYARYLYLVRQLRAQGYRPPTLGDTPFVFVDLTFNSILAAAEADLDAALARARRRRRPGERCRGARARGAGRALGRRAGGLRRGRQRRPGGRDRRCVVPALRGRRPIASRRAVCSTRRSGRRPASAPRPRRRGR